MNQTHRLNRGLGWLTGMVLALALPACGQSDGKRPVFPVSGKVLIDGQPGHEVRLLFIPTNTADTMAPKPTAITDEQGNLIVTTYVTGDGAPEGEYKISLEWPKMVNYFGRMQPGPDRLGGKYKNAAASKWTVFINAGNNTLPDFDIKTK